MRVHDSGGAGGHNNRDRARLPAMREHPPEFHRAVFVCVKRHVVHVRPPSLTVPIRTICRT
jgi:hypothetical protein